MFKHALLFIFITLLSACSETGSGAWDSRIVSGLTLSPQNPLLLVGEQVQMQALATFSDEGEKEINADVIWAVEDATIASIDSTGLLSALTIGTTVISASRNEVTISTSVSVGSGDLERLEIIPAVLNAPKGTQQAFQAIAIYENGNTADVTTWVSWSSSNALVLSIIASGDSAGLATLITQGQAVVTANIDTFEAQASVTVTAATLTEIIVSPPSKDVPLGSHFQFLAVGVFSDNSSVDITEYVQWQSSSPEMVAITSAGLVNGLSIGNSTITATLDALSSTAEVSVSDVALNSLLILPLIVDSPTGTTQQLTLLGRFSDNSVVDLTHDGNWDSSNADVANVINSGEDAGFLQLLMPGTATVSAAYAGQSASIAVTSTEKQLQEILLAPINADTTIGLTVQYAATGVYDDGSHESITDEVSWQSLQPSIASIDLNGLATALDEGKTDIQATFAGISAQTSLTVTGRTLTQLSIIPATAEMVVGTSQALQALAYYQDGSTEDVTSQTLWKTTDNTVAFAVPIGANAGKLLALGEGQVDAQAYFAGKSAQTAISVKVAILTEILIEPAASEVAAGTALAYSAVGVFNNGRHQIITDDVAWNSSDPTIASIDISGRARTYQVGEVSISADYLGLQASTSLIVMDATVTALRIFPNTLLVPQGTQSQLRVAAIYSDFSIRNVTKQALWNSDDEAVYAVVASGESAGLGSAIAVGDTRVEVSFSGQTASIAIAVSAVTLNEIIIEPFNSELPIGLSLQYSATGIYSDASQVDLSTQVDWQSLDVAVASIDLQGIVTANSVGATSIQASYAGIINSTNLIVSAASVVSLQIEPANITLAKGEHQQYTATAVFSDNSIEDVTSQTYWHSTDPTIAKIVSSGDVAGLLFSRKKGEAEIVANFLNLSTKVMVTVTDATLSGIAIYPRQLNLAKGEQQQYVAVGSYSDGSKHRLTGPLAWESSASTIASIDGDGLLIAHLAGESEISLQVESYTAQANVHVSDASLTEIQVTPALINTVVGAYGQLTATAFYSDKTSADVTTQVTWASANSAIAVVGNDQHPGAALATGQGSTVITASLGGHQGESLVSVSAAILVDLLIHPEDVLLQVGGHKKYVATGVYSDGSHVGLNHGVNWSSDNTAIATISERGIATAVKAGAAGIHAGYQGFTAAADLSVNNAQLLSIVVRPSNISLPAGAKFHYRAVGFYSDLSRLDITDTVTWASSDEAIIAIDNEGLAEFIGLGVATVSASLSSVIGSAPATTIDAVLTSITISPTHESVPVGGSIALTATAHFSDNSAEIITDGVSWQSQNTAIAVVSSSGVVQTLNAGETQIYASILGRTGEATITVTGAVLESLQVSALESSLAVGLSTQAQCLAFYSDGRAVDVTAQSQWYSADSAIASVYPDAPSAGLIQAKSIGDTQIHCEYLGVDQSMAMNVSAATLSSIYVSPLDIAIPAGTHEQYTAFAILSDHTHVDISAHVVWSSSNTVAAVIDEQGLAVGMSNGITTISASVLGKTASTSLTISNAVLNEIQITPFTLTQAAGSQLYYTARGLYSDDTDKDITQLVVWRSSDTEKAAIVATGENGGYTQLFTQGDVKISASLASIKAVDASLTISATTLQRIVLEPVMATVPNGIDVQYHATGYYLDGSSAVIDDSVSWQSDNPSVASISISGLASTLDAGTAMITASSDGISAQATLQVSHAVVTALQITPDAVTAPVGTTGSLQAWAQFSDNSQVDVTALATWQSSNIGVVNVIASGTDAGLAQIKGSGSASLTATYANITAGATVNGVATTLQSITLSPASSTLAKGIKQQYSATGHYLDGSSVDITEQVTWDTGDILVASIGATGLLSAVGEGTTNVTADFGGLQGTGSISVSAATLQSISVTPWYNETAAGTTTQLQAVATFSDKSQLDITDQATWQSANTHIAIVGSVDHPGLVLGVAVGSTVVSAHYMQVQGSVVVNITQAVLSDVLIQPVDNELRVGGILQYAAVGVYSDNTSKPITQSVQWSSSDTAIASIDTQGLATATGVGVATITASVDGFNPSTALTVVALDVVAVIVEPLKMRLPVNATRQYTATAYYNDFTAADVTDVVAWSSSMPAFVSINSTGLATFVADGTAIISADFSGQTGTASATTLPITVSSVTVVPQNNNIPVGAAVQLSATANLSNGESVELSTGVTWASSNANVVVNGTGLALGNSVGNATVTATVLGVSGGAGVVVSSAVITHLQLSPAVFDLPIGLMQPLTCTAYYSDGNTVDVTASANWSSEDTAIATVDISGATKGTATGIAIGQTQLHCGFDGKQVSSAVTVIGASLQSIVVEPANQLLPIGLQQRYTAEGIYSDGQSLPLVGVNWQSSALNIAQINSDGMATAIAEGTSSISAEFNGIVGTTDLTVVSASISAVQVSPVNGSHAKGSRIPYEMTVYYSDGTNAIITALASWSSNNEPVVSIAATGTYAGIASFLMPGTAQITGKFLSFSDTVTATVTNATLTRIQVNPSNKSVGQGASIAYTAIGIYSDGSARNINDLVSWQSSNLAVADITAEGLAQTLSVGQTDIKATLGAVSAFVPLTVTAATVNGLHIEPSTVTAPSGTSGQLIAIATYTNGAEEDVTRQSSWISSNSARVSVVTSGEDAGLAVLQDTGAANVFAHYGIYTAVMDVTVTAAELTSIQVTPVNESVPQGLSVQYTALGIYSDSSTLDITHDVTWQSSDTAVAVIDADGLATTVITGAASILNTTISATLMTISGDTLLSVVDAQVNDLQITPPQYSAAAGTTEQYTATAYYTDGSSKNVSDSAVWQSSDESKVSIIASGDEGGLAALRAVGHATITADFESYSDTVNIEVTDAVLTGVSIDPVFHSTPLGIEVQYRAYGELSDGSVSLIENGLSWSVNNEALALIDASGLLQTLASGIVTVTVNVSGFMSVAVLNISPALVIDLQISPPFLLEPAGTSGQLDLDAIYSDGSIVRLTTQALWRSSNASVTEVVSGGENAGFTYLLAPGTALISASFENLTTAINVEVNIAALIEIQVEPLNETVALGLTQQYQAIGIFSDGSSTPIDSDVTWYSSNNGIATITETGLAEGVFAGNTSIEAHFSGLVGSTHLTVSDAAIVEIEVGPINHTMLIGQTEQYQATAIFSDASTLDITGQAQWQSSDTTVAHIVASSKEGQSVGGVVAVGAGSSVISATYDAVIGQADLQVDAVTVNTIEIISAHTGLPLGVSSQWEALAYLSDDSVIDITEDAAWQSSDNTVASVSQGLIQSLAIGEANISILYQDQVDEVLLSIINPTLESIIINPSYIAVAVNHAIAFEAIGQYSDGSNGVITTSVTWSSSDTSVAVVSNSEGSEGLATAVAVGSVSISASLGEDLQAATLEVITNDLTAIEVSPGFTSVSEGSDMYFNAIGIYASGERLDISQQVTWQSLDSGIVLISNALGSKGLASAASVGSTAVRAIDETSSIESSAAVTVVPSCQDNSGTVALEVQPQPASVSVGGSIYMELLTVDSAGCRTNITRGSNTLWESLDINIAEKKPGNGNQGRFTGVALGAADIQASLQDEFVNISVTGLLNVIAEEIGGVTVSPASVNMNVGDEVLVQCHAQEVLKSQVPVATAVWLESHEQVVTIGDRADNSIAVQALSLGEVSVCCYYNAYRACMDVTVE